MLRQIKAQQGNGGKPKEAGGVGLGRILDSSFCLFLRAEFRSVTGRAYHFEPLNAKQIERPSSSIFVETLESAGCEPVEETGQGFPFRPHSSKHRADASQQRV